ncbi:MAG: peptidoglycan-binding domain-containing protein [Anaerolineae bacterium]
MGSERAVQQPKTNAQRTMRPTAAQSDSPVPAHHALENVLMLQRTLGNRALQRLAAGESAKPSQPFIKHSTSQQKIQRECADDAEFCTPYSSIEEALVVKETLGRLVVEYVSARISPEAGQLWQEYLSRRHGDSLSPKVFTEGSAVGRSFVNSKTTQERQQELITLVKQALPGACRQVPTGTWADIPLESLLSSEQLNFPINFNQIHETPGNIAGGVGSSDAGPDTRRVSGSVSLKRDAATAGVIMKTNFLFHVQDAVDLCPGDCGAAIEQLATVPLSRLEATGVAYDVPFEVHYHGPSQEIPLEPGVVTPCSGPSGDQDANLTSPRFAGDTRLEQAFDNERYIARGTRGDSVAKIQQALIDAGYDMPISTQKTGSPDGIFGRETQRVVKQFQRDHGLGDDGVIGHDTMDALDKMYPPTSPPPAETSTETASQTPETEDSR